MPTRLRRGQSVVRVVPSRLHECRAGELVVTLDNTGAPTLTLRPLKTRRPYSYPLDALYEYIVMRHAELQRKQRKEKKRARAD